MGVFLRRYFEPEQVDESTGEVVPPRNRFEKVIGESGELEKQFAILTLNRGKDNEVSILMERGHGIEWAPFPDDVFEYGHTFEDCPACGERRRYGYEQWLMVGEKAWRNPDATVHEHQ